MIKSMTGFGRAEESNENCRFTVELKSVNHRYLDINIKMPKKLNFLENKIRSVLKKYMQRGKVDVFIGYEDFTGNGETLHYNEALAKQYLTFLRQMQETFDLEDDIRVSTLSRYPDVFTMEEEAPDEDALWSVLEKVLDNAAKQFADSRVVEGENLRKDLCEKLEKMLTYVEFIEEKSPEIVKTYKKNLEEKVEELLGNHSIDEGRIATEVTIYADKICVDEETVRLRSHIKTAIDVLSTDSKESVGRKLDFIAQEMNREANTILSKTNDIEVSDVGINLKTDIEKVREQIQNIE